MNPYTTYFGGAAFTALTMAVHLALATTVTRTSALLSVTEQRNSWMTIVDNADTGAVCASEDGFVGTLDEAKRRAFQMRSEVVAPFVDAARAEERETCARLVDQLAIKASSSWHRHQEVLRDAAAAIRARSKEPKP